MIPIELVPKLTCSVCRRVAYDDEVEGFLRIVPVIGTLTSERVSRGERVEVRMHKGEVCGVECARTLLTRDPEATVLNDQGDGSAAMTPAEPDAGHPGQFL